MLAYRHAFHAGNHADVLKHAILIAVLRHMNLKDKAWRLVDTHAGAGAYELNSDYAQKHAEYTTGIGAMWSAPQLPALLKDYVDQVRAFNPDQTLSRYPGSPEIVRGLMRAQDQLRLFELHPTDQGLLAERFAGDRQVMVARGDGFAGLKSQLPPPSRRGVLLIDPSYEIKTDYPAVVDAVTEALRRFAECVVLVWYPHVDQRESAQLPRQLKAVAQAQAPKGWLHTRLHLALPNERGFGLLGSGMFVVNPPFTLREPLKAAMGEMLGRMGQFPGAQGVLEDSESGLIRG